jgi:O-methyltransferase
VTDTADLYIELLKKSLTHSLYGGADALRYPPTNPIKRLIVKAMRRRNFVPVQIVDLQDKEKSIGSYWPMFAQTMIGMQRLENLQNAVEAVLDEGVKGDFVEAGVWRGGATIFMRGLLKVRGITDRTVWVADSFAGLPAPDPDHYPADSGSVYHAADDLAVPLEEVQENFRRYGLLDDQVQFLKGWFKDTLPTLRDRQFAIVRLDGDMYESTMDGLCNLYPALSPGGFLIVDDYSIDSCAEAVNDFRADYGITDPVQEIDWSGVFWRKSAPVPATKV